MELDWSKLISFNGSQNNAFEELVCQLARSEDVLNAKNFIRKGVPDAGVECYWKLEDGSEYCWQAKFFKSFGKAQINQIDESFQTALETHPQLTKYIVAFPFDLSDPRLDKKEFAKQRWDALVKKWTESANELGRNVTIEYWGSFEINYRLAVEVNAGRRAFWFGTIELTETWFNSKLDESIKNLDKRYTPELNFELDIAKVFDGLERDSAYSSRIIKEYKQFKGRLKSAIGYLPKEEVDFDREYFIGKQKDIENLFLSFQLKNIYHTVAFSETLVILQELAQKCTDKWDFAYKLERQIQIEKEEAALKKGDKLDYHSKYYKYGDVITSLRNLETAIYALIDFIESPTSNLVNDPVLLLTGEAGIGKSHLLADIAVKRKKENKSTILLLGQHFTKGDPWAFIRSQLFPNSTKEQFLGALNAKAESQGSRILLMIDAINEGEGKFFWRDYIAGFIEGIKSYKWIGLVLSVRNSYINVLVPENLKVERIEHTGFSENEYEASKLFFYYYGIQQPSVPLLHPEFTKPLFLHLFCKGLSQAGLKFIPPGHEGINTVINFYLEAVNAKLSEPSAFDYNPKLKIVQKITEKFAFNVARSNTGHLLLSKAHELVEEIARKNSLKSGLLNHLISEGIFTENPFYNRTTSAYDDGIYLAYEKFQDHLVASYIINRDNERTDNTFLREYLANLLAKGWEANYEIGTIDALAIQIPEKMSCELFEFLGNEKLNLLIARSVIDSLIWRKSDKIDPEKLKPYFNECINAHPQLDSEFLNTLLSITAQPFNPFNSDFLHAQLIDLSMAERDAWWSIFLHNSYSDRDSSAINRIIDWSWQVRDKSYLDKDSRKLLGKTICWFFTSSNRFLRDRATKALVSLISDHPDTLIDIWKEFGSVNDLYVTERIYAVAMGIVLRNSKTDKTNLIQYIYDLTFANGKPPVHILIRDYAKTSVEYGIAQKLPIAIDEKLIAHPYGSDWPEIIPSAADIEKYNVDYKDENWSVNAIYSSVTGYDDFSRYVIGESHFSSFYNVDLKKILRAEAFINKLSKAKQKTFETFSSFYKWSKYRPDDYHKLPGIPKDDFPRRLEEFKEHSEFIEVYLTKALKKVDKEIFKNDVKYYLDKIEADRFDREYFDMNIIKRLVIERVFSLGYDPKLFNFFDMYLTKRQSYGRSERKPERIGKKYQWIALHEYLARLSDNFVFRDKWYYEDGLSYMGPWQLYRRDIDTSVLLPYTHDPEFTKTNYTWWFSEKYNSWDVDPLKWYSVTDDLPNFKNIISVNNNGSEWLVLESMVSWNEPEKLSTFEEKFYKKHIWSHIRSYIVKKSQKAAIHKWLAKQHFMGRWMPESGDLHSFYWREIPWSAAFLTYDDEGLWKSVENSKERCRDGKVVVTTGSYCWDKSYDCSVSSSLSIYYPVKFLHDLLKLKPSVEDNAFESPSGEIVCFDPSVQGNNGPRSLLIKKDYLQRILDENDLDIVWTVLGEKQVLGDYSGRFLRFLEFSGAYCISDTELEGELIHRIDRS